MGRNEKLKDNTYVLWNLGEPYGSYRVTFVDGFAKLEHHIHGSWYIGRLTLDAQALLSAFVTMYLAGKRVQIDLACANHRLAQLEGTPAQVKYWKKVERHLRQEIDAYPPPFNEWRRP